MAPKVADLLERGRKENDLLERMKTLVEKTRAEDRVFTEDEQNQWADMQREAEQLKEQRASYQEYTETRDAFLGNQVPETRTIDNEPKTPDEIRERIG